MATVIPKVKNPRNVCYAVNAQTPANRGVKNYRVERYYCVNLAKKKSWLTVGQVIY